MLSSTGGAAEHQGGQIGEYVEAGEHGGRPYFIQRDTEGESDFFLYRTGSNWLVSNTLGKTSANLLNSQDTPQPPLDGWAFSDGGPGWNYNDTSLTLAFTALSPCKMVRVAGDSNVKEKQNSKLGAYRSAFFSVTYIIQSGLSSSRDIETYTL